MRIEAATPADAPAIEALLDAAFGTDRRQRPAYRLRAGLAPIAALSLVARQGAALLGSAQCWPLALDAADGSSHSLRLLGPVAVAPARQGAGIGRALVTAVLARAGEAPMLLIGDAPYYARWGFSAAATAGWATPGAVPRARLLFRGRPLPPALGTLRPG